MQFETGKESQEVLIDIRGLKAVMIINETHSRIDRVEFYVKGGKDFVLYAEQAREFVEKYKKKQKELQAELDELLYPPDK